MRAEHVTPPVPPALRGYVARWTGYRLDGLAPGTHRGLPSPWLTVVISLGAPTALPVSPDPAQGPGAYAALVGGFHVRPAVIAYDEELFGVQLALTPAGARALLGLPAGALSPAVLELDAVLGPDAERLLTALHDAPSWAARFAVLGRALARRARDAPSPAAPLDAAWQLLTTTRGVRVRDVADTVGWSRRQLQDRFLREFGLTPKQASQVARFERTREALQTRAQRGAPVSLAGVAAAAGYADQAHMAREWNALAGCPPSRWLADEDLPFVQDDDPLPVGASAA